MSTNVDELFSDIRSRIDKVLEIKNLKQVDLATKCDIKPTTLSKAIERNKLGVDIVDKINKHLNIRKEFLLKGEEPVEGPEIPKPLDQTTLLNTLKTAVDTISRQNNSIIETSKDLRKQNDRLVTMLEDLTRLVVSKKEKQNL